jgi:hypothetical protein
MSGLVRLLLLALCLLVPAPGPAAAQAPAPATTQEQPTKETPPAPIAGQPANPLALDSPSIYQRSLAALTMLFVIAVLLENAFATIFNWRVFLTYFYLAGVKTIVMVAISLIVVNVFNIDVLANLIAVYKTPAGEAITPSAVAHEFGYVSKFVTALILAGGSTGVNNIMRALGYRNDQREQEAVQRPPPDKAWVAVKVKRTRAVGTIQVRIGKVTPPAGAQTPTAIAGTIGSSLPSLKELLLRNLNRYPQNGGHTVDPDTPYHIVVEGKDGQNQPLSAIEGDYVFARGAIVNFEATL